MTGPTRVDDPGEPSTSIPRVGIDPQEGEILAALARNKRVLEIGTGLGTSTRALAQTAAMVDTVDIDPWVHRHIFGELRILENVRCHSRIPPDMGWEMVFVDGDHRPDAVRNDLTTCRDVCPSGIWVFHDAHELREQNLLTGSEWELVATEYGIALRIPAPDSL